MPFETSLSFRGLNTSPNNLGAGSEGALVEADNVVIRFPDVLEPRRGQEAVTVASWTNPVSQVAFFDDDTLIHSESANKIRFVGAAQNLTGDYSAAQPDGFSAYRLKTAVNGRHLHAATDLGVVVIESADTVTPRVSGIQAPTLPIGAVVPDTGSPVPPGWLADGESVAYRVVFGFKDENDVIHLGPPSERIVVTNTTGSLGNVYLGVLLITAPVDVNGDLIPGLFVQFYRSAVVTSPTLPTELLQLATEVNVDTTEYTRNSEFFTTDIAPPQFVAAQLPLYTNDEREGSTQANSPAPYSTDLASWSQRLWYANTRQPDSLAVQLLGVGGGGNTNLDATGLRVGDTITINTGAMSVTLTASTGTNSNAQTFQVYSAGTPSENISRTLEQLATCVNGQVALDRSDIIAYLVTDTTFNIRSNILFRRLTVDAASSVGFTVTYATPLLTCTYTSSVGTTHTFTLAGHGFLVGDKVEMRSTAVVSFITPVTITAITTNTFTFVSTNPNISLATKVKRRFANTVWNPDLSVGQTSENQLSPERLYYSKVLEPEAVPALNYIDVGTAGKPILRIQPQRDRLLVLKEEGTFAIYGDYPFSAQLVDDTVQLIAPDSVTAIGSTVFALMDDGVVAITEGSIQPIDEPIDSLLKPYFASLKLTTTATAFGVGYESEKVFALFMPDIGVTGYNAKAYVYGLTSGAWTTWSFPVERKCGRVSPSLDAGFYGLQGTGSRYLAKDRKTSSVEDYLQETNSAIVSTVRWAPTTLGTPYATKQVREAHFHFREAKRNPTVPNKGVEATFSLKTDIVPAGESIPVIALTDTTIPASSVIGPAELPLQFRKLVPQFVQRATYFTLGLSARVSQSYWALNGYTLVFDSTSERTGTVR